jgi:hypothetical protein
MKVYSDLAIAYFEALAADPSSGASEGRFYYNTTSGVLKWRTSGAWKTAVDTDTVQTLSNKSFGTGISVTGDVTISGLTALGSGNTPIKVKVVTGTVSGSDGGLASAAHGLADPDQILGFSVLVKNNGTDAVLPEYTGDTGYQYSVYHSATNINVKRKLGNSANISGRPFIAVITYVDTPLASYT